MTNTPVIAAFDFDGTLTYQDTLIPFLNFTFGPKFTLKKLLRLLPQLSCFLIGLKTRQEAKELILSSFLKGLPLSTVNAWGKDFAQNKLSSLIRNETYQKLKMHQSQGHTCVLISANLSFYLAPWGEFEGLNAVLASELEVNGSQKITGRLLGKNCWGEEKVRRLEEAYGPKQGPKKNYTLFAYGDSRGDKELLKLADYPFFI